MLRQYTSVVGYAICTKVTAKSHGSRMHKGMLEMPTTCDIGWEDSNAHSQQVIKRYNNYIWV